MSNLINQSYSYFKEEFEKIKSLSHINKIFPEYKIIKNSNEVIYPKGGLIEQIRFIQYSNAVDSLVIRYIYNTNNLLPFKKVINSLGNNYHLFYNVYDNETQIIYFLNNTECLIKAIRFSCPDFFEYIDDSNIDFVNFKEFRMFFTNNIVLNLDGWTIKTN